MRGEGYKATRFLIKKKKKLNILIYLFTYLLL
jgi:hypothetical protein